MADIIDRLLEDNWDAADEIKQLRAAIANCKTGPLVSQAVERERERFAKIAHDHAKFCENEARNGGSKDLYERAKGAFHTARQISDSEREK